MEKKQDYLFKYWMDYYLNVDDIGEITIRTKFKSKKYPDINYEVSVLDDKRLIVLLPVRTANKLKKKYPEILEEESDSDEGKQLSFEEKYLKQFEEEFKLVKKDFPDDKELVLRFLNYKRKKIEQKKKRRQKKQVY